MTHLAVLKKDTRLFAPRPGELQSRSRPVHALQLNDVGNMEIAQRSMKFFAVSIRRPEQGLDQIDKITLRKRFFQKVDRAEPRNLLALGSDVGRCEKNCARVRVTRAQVVEEFLAEVGAGIDIEDEEIGLSSKHKTLRFLQAVRDVHLCARCSVF